MTGALASAVKVETKKRRRPLIAALLTGALVGGTAGPALANYVYQGGTIDTFGSDYCVNSRSEVSHGAYNGGYWKTDTETKQEDFYTGINCITPWGRPAGYLAAHVQGWRYSGGTWYVCFNEGYKYNSSSTARLVLAVQEPNGTPPCGNGYYHNLARSYTKSGSTWYGGTLNSGNHYLPAS